ncbi:MAG: vWA domain-containing protein [Acidimicrobiia bacterium]
MPEAAPVLPALVGFGQALRGEGLHVGTGQLLAYCHAVATLDPSDRDDVYWAGRACLVTRHDDEAAYDRAFRRYFTGGPGGVEMKVTGDLRRFSVTLPADERRPALPAPPPPTPATPRGSLASSAESLRTKRFAECTPAELAELQRMLDRLRLVTPRRRSRRTAPSARGDAADLRRSIRRSLRTSGEVVRIARRQRRLRHRRLVLLLDISGSMADYSRALLRFAHSAASSRPVPTEVFCFGTRLTRLTVELRRRRPDDALARAAEAVVDWEGGTRIGESLRTFLRDWGRRGLARGAVVVICSDGLDRGEPAVLAAEMERLSRLAHRVVWLNPLKGDERYQPLARGMSAALPHVDVFLAGHDFTSLESLAGVLRELV